MLKVAYSCTSVPLVLPATRLRYAALPALPGDNFKIAVS